MNPSWDDGKAVEIVSTSLNVEVAAWQASLRRRPAAMLVQSAELPIFYFAGFSKRCNGVRQVKDGPGEHGLFGFLTTQLNAVVKPIHEKAMPVILTTQVDVDTWLTAPWQDARSLQRPAPEDAPVVVEKSATEIKFPPT